MNPTDAALRSISEANYVKCLCSVSNEAVRSVIVAQRGSLLPDPGTE